MDLTKNHGFWKENVEIALTAYPQSAFVLFIELINTG